MRHWCILMSPSAPPAMGFVAGGGPSRGPGFSASDQRRIFWLGLVEATPLVGAFTAGSWIESIPLWVWGCLGAVLCLATCWKLRHQTPWPVIHVSPQQHSEDHGTQADCGCCGRRGIECDSASVHLYPLWKCPCGAVGSGAWL